MGVAWGHTHMILFKVVKDVTFKVTEYYIEFTLHIIEGTLPHPLQTSSVDHPKGVARVEHPLVACGRIFLLLPQDEEMCS